MKKNNIKLELFKLDELPGNWTPRESGEKLKEALRDLEKSDDEILEKYRPADMAAAIKAKHERQSNDNGSDEIPFGRRFGSRILLPAAAAAVLALAVILPLTLREPAGNGLELTRFKGAAETQLKVYRASGSGTESLDSGSIAREYDLLQISYRTGEPEFGMILSVDGRGVVTRHYPEETENAGRLQSGGEQYLPFAYELDDAPAFETFYLITADRPFSAEEVMDVTSEAAAAGEQVLDIPKLYKKSTPRSTPRLRQYAVPIRKDGNDQ